MRRSHFTSVFYLFGSTILLSSIHLRSVTATADISNVIIASYQYDVQVHCSASGTVEGYRLDVGGLGEDNGRWSFHYDSYHDGYRIYNDKEELYLNAKSDLSSVNAISTKTSDNTLFKMVMIETESNFESFALQTTHGTFLR